MSSAASARLVAAWRAAVRRTCFDHAAATAGLEGHRDGSRTVSSGNRAAGWKVGRGQAGPERWAQVADVLAHQLDAAGGGDESADGVHQGGLAGAVGADQPDDLLRRTSIESRRWPARRRR